MSSAVVTRPDAPVAAGGDPGPSLVLDGVTKRFGRVVALDGVDLTVRRGELLAVVGPSGCGKSTLLRAVAGLTGIDAGRVATGGRDVVGPGMWVPPERRGVGVVFQDLALFPHLSVRQNIAFGLDRQRTGRDERILEVLDLVGMAALADRHPHELSGGEQQRVALARALAPRPSVVLLDEPFSHLDAGLRVQVRDQAVEVLRAAGATCVFVTHDQEEAMAVGDRVAVARAGRLEQVDVPEALFYTPASRFVATFVGEANFLPARAQGPTATTELGTVPLVAPATGATEVLLRPHELGISRAVEGGPPGQDVGGPGAPATVTRTEFRGATVLLHLRLDSGTRLRSVRPAGDSVGAGDRVVVSAVPVRGVPDFPVRPSD